MSDTDERLMIATYEALQAQVDEHSKQIADIMEGMNRIGTMLEKNLEEWKARVFARD